MNTKINTTSNHIKKLIIATALVHSLMPTPTRCAAQASFAKATKTRAAVAKAMAPEKKHQKAIAETQLTSLTYRDINDLFGNPCLERMSYGEKKALIKKEFQSSKISINATVDKKDDWTEPSLLIFFLREKNTQMAQILVELDANPNKEDNCGYTPLIVASINGLTNIANILIQHSADINKSDHDDMPTPLAAAIKNDHTDLTNMLIQRGANVNKGYQGVRSLATPLTLAIEKNLPHLVTTLILANAEYAAEEFETFSDDIKAIIHMTEQAKNELDHQDWLPEELAEDQLLPIHASRAEFDIRGLIAEYAHPINPNLYTPEVRHCIALEIQRKQLSKKLSISYCP